MNKWFGIGNLTRDPELTETSSGIKICRFSLAVNRSYKTADGEKITDFLNCQAWRQLAETIARYTHKGDKVAVTGSIETRSYEDKQGNKRTAVEIAVQDIEFLNSRQNSSNGDNSGSNVNGGKKPSYRQQSLIPDEDDSDIPF